jgi:hypothetical protein
MTYALLQGLAIGLVVLAGLILHGLVELPELKEEP